VTQTATASSAVLVGAGAGNSQDTVGNGAAIMVNDTQKTLDILTANPMGGTPRNDIVVFDSATTSIRAIIGTPNAIPTDPTVPTTAIPLARIRNLASATTIPTAQIDSLIVPIGLFGVQAAQAAADAAAARVLGFKVKFDAPAGLTTSAGGHIVYAHGLGTAVAGAVITFHGDVLYTCSITGLDATNVTFRVKTANTGSTVNSTAVAFSIAVFY
jgi:hypothetical protein